MAEYRESLPAVTCIPRRVVQVGTPTCEVRHAYKVWCNRRLRSTELWHPAMRRLSHGPRRLSHGRRRLFHPSRRLFHGPSRLIHGRRNLFHGTGP